MGNMPLRFRKAPTVFLGVASLLCLGAPLHAANTATPNRAQDEDASRRQIDEFNRFLDGHRDVAVELHSKPWLVTNYNYLQSHPELKSYLEAHPGLQDAIGENPVAFMKEDAQRSELAQFSRFLDTNREIAEQLRRDPASADNYAFLQDHPQLKAYLDEHPSVKQALHENASQFMKEEEGFDRYAGGGDRDRDMDARNGDMDRDRDVNRRNAAEFEHFLDSHREIAEQVRRNPSLVNDRQFVQNHPALQTFLQNNPGVRDDLRQNPNAFMNQEARYDHPENGANRDAMHDHMADFGGFLGEHRDIARDLDKDPTKVKNKEFVQNRPDLDNYLNAHPDVRSDLMANPQDFVKGAQQMTTKTSGASTTGSGSGTTGTGGTSGTTDPTGSKGSNGNQPQAPKTNKQ
jgi:hypothetical protein